MENVKAITPFRIGKTLEDPYKTQGKAEGFVRQQEEDEEEFNQIQQLILAQQQSFQQTIQAQQ